MKTIFWVILGIIFGMITIGYIVKVFCFVSLMSMVFNGILALLFGYITKLCFEKA